jgi:hypothetical protein
MRFALFLVPVALLALAPARGWGQEMSQPMRMMQPPPPLQWPTISLPPTPAVLLSTPKVMAVAPVGFSNIYPYTFRSYSFHYERGYTLQDGTRVSGQYDWRRRW